MPAPIESSKAIKERYLNSDKKVNIKDHLNQMEKEEKSGLKGIDVHISPKQLGKDDFLKLLITQLSKQDPTNPVKDQDFIAQMAQFSSLEQMKNISAGIQKLEAKQAYNLVGKFVSGPDYVSGEPLSGVAHAVFYDGEGKAFVRVNGRTMETDKIQFISDPAIMKQAEEAAKAMENKAPQFESPQTFKKQEEKNVNSLTEEAKSNDTTKEQRENEWKYPGVRGKNQESYTK